MTIEQYWLTASAAFVGTGVFMSLVLIGTYVLTFVARRREQRAERKAGPQVRKPAPRVSEQVGSPPEPQRPGSLFEPAQRSRREMTPHEREDTLAMAAVRREMPNDYKLAEPPMVGDETLFAYLKHHAPMNTRAATWDSEGMGVWASVVDTFYSNAGADPRVAAHFEHVDMDTLRRHFTRALVTLFSTGLTVEQADDLGRTHAHLGITEDEFDAVTQHLVRTLQAYLRANVFDLVMPQLAPAVQALRVRIVRPQVRTA